MTKRVLNKLERAALQGIRNEAKQAAGGDGTIHMTLNDMQTLAFNALLRRRDLITTLLDQKHDIDGECGYPTSISINDYKTLYDRNGIAARVVSIWPDECFSEELEVYETEGEEPSPFEKAWLALHKNSKTNVTHFMNRVDTQSGLGTFGIVLFGIGDGKPLNQPVEGIDLVTGLPTKPLKYPLLYLRVFSEYYVQIAAKETGLNSPRYGYPTMYDVTFAEDDVLGMGMQPAGEAATRQITGQRLQVHWTRVQHIADNRDCSEIHGVPRMQRVFNDLLNIRKTLGGSAEMFWRGGFPGIAFEMDSSNEGGIVEVTDAAKTTMQDNIKSYFAGLDRALLLENVKAKPMSPQVADPTAHFETQIQAICMSLGCPVRIFMGTEEAKLASTQDQKAWDRRVMRRQLRYLTPMLVQPIVDQLIAYGVLPVPKNGYKVWWHDRAALTEAEVAEVASKETDAMAKYVAGGVAQIIAPKHWFVDILKKTPDEAAKFEQGVKDMELEIMIPGQTAGVEEGGRPTEGGSASGESGQ